MYDLYDATCYSDHWLTYSDDLFGRRDMSAVFVKCAQINIKQQQVVDFFRSKWPFGGEKDEEYLVPGLFLRYAEA